MPRRAVPSTRLVARVRAWFGLHQDELAVYLGVSPSLVRGLESGRRSLSAALLPALLPLAQHLPAPENAAPPAPTLPPGTAAPDAAELDFRLRVCQQQAAKLEAELAQLATRAWVANRWAQALPVLLAVPAETPATPETADRAAWRADWLHRRARPLPAEVATRWHLLQARLLALNAETEALAALLPTPA